MKNQTLATKYRPTTLQDVTEQEYIKIILESQIKTNSIKNAYLFCGGAGTGKTTTARIFANSINNNLALPIEVDAASNNGVDNIRTIIEDAKFKPIQGNYKVFIIDECHMLSIGAWNAMLKLLEEPPKTTVFILCTTDPQKIPATILSRVQRYDFQRISLDGIVNRLKYIIQQENREYDGTWQTNDVELDDKYGKILYNDGAISYIAKIADGGMRDAISLLDKCLSYTHKLTINNVTKALGISDYADFYGLLQAIIQSNDYNAIAIIEDVFQQGKDLKQFIKQLINFTLDVCKYSLYQNYDYISIPNTISLTLFTNTDYNLLINILDKFIQINNNIKYETNAKVLIESGILILIENL